MGEKKIRPSVLLVKDGKILVLKSRYSSGELYLLPGGRIEKDETIEETAIRETKEETNYDVTLNKLLYIQEWIDNRREKNLLNAVFLGKILQGEETHLKDPCLTEGKIHAIEWKTPEELRCCDFHPKAILDRLEKDMEEGFKYGAEYLPPEIVR
ncbi:MAG: NUDIX hydrolase [Candidatus Woesearchaeota archaeon]